MSSRPFRRALLALLCAATLVRCGGGDDLTLPSEGLPTAIAALAGDGQSGTVGQPLPDTLIARVTDAKDRPVQGARVVFQAIAGGAGADLIPDTAVTDADGQARSVWLLGTLAGQQRVEARVIVVPPATTVLKTPFTATALAAAADTILVVKGQGQVGTVGAVLTDSLGVLVTDRFGNPISGRTVSWTVPGGQGSVSAASTVTGADGRTAVTRRLGPNAGAQTAAAASAGLKGSPVSFTHTATAGGATTLVKVHGDAQTAPAGFQLTDSLVVQARDANGNGVPGLSVIWVVATGGGSVTAQSSVTDAQGRAFTFWNLGPAAGGNTVTAAVTGLPQVSFSATGTSAQPAAIQAQSATSQGGTAGAPVTALPSVKVTDLNNNPVPGVTVTFAVTQGGGSVSDGQGSGPSVSIPTNAGGVATLTSWTLGTAAGSNALTATAAGTGISGNPVSFTATAAAGAPAWVRITTEPSTAAQVGVALATQPQARLVDQFGNAVAQAGTTVSLTVLGGGATLRGGASQVTGAGGTVAWSGLDLVGPVGGYALVASAGALAPDTTVTIALGAGPASKLGLATAPGASAQSGALLAPQPAVQVQDLAGNAVAQAGVPVTAAIATGGGTLGGTLTQQSNASGVASFTDLAISGSSGGRTLAFSAPGLTGVSSGTITIGAGTATQLALTTAPSTTAQSGSLLATQPVVQLRDASNNPAAQAGVAVTVSVSTGGVLAGTTTINTNAQGQAAFSGLAISGPAGSYTLSFAATGLTSVTSAAITLSAGSGAKLAFVTAPPAAGQSGQALAPATVVQLLDAADNPVAQAGVSLTATIATGAGGTLGGTPTVATNAQGQASFANLVLSGAAGSYTLAFGGTGLTGVTSAAITLAAGAATQLAFVTPPAATAQSGVPLTTVPVVQLQDGGGNAVAQAGVGVTVSLASGGGSLGGTSTAATDAQGQATFTGLTISGLAGPRTLGFASSGLTGLTSGSITLSAGPAAALTLQAGNGQSAVAGSPVAINPAVKVTDAAGNAVGGITVNFEVTAGGGSVGAPTVATDGLGIAAQGWTLGSTAGSNTLIAFAALQGGTDTVTFTATGTAGSAGRLAILLQPSASSASGSAFLIQPQVQLQDQNGNPLLTTGTAIQVTASGATLGGTTTVTTVLGIASFTNLSLTGLAGSYTLTFSAPGQSITGVTSTAITLTAGAAARLAVVTQPGGTPQSGIILPQQPVVQVQDAAGNPVAAAGRTVVAAINSGPGGLVDPVGRNVSTSAQGTASYTALRLTGPVGAYSFIFTSAGLASDTSDTFVLAAGTPVTVAASAPTSQSAPAGSAVASPPAVLVSDGAGNPVPGVPVTFAVTAGGGSLNGATPQTDALGIATVAGWTLGPVAGANTVTATVSGSGISGNPVTFSATGTAASATTIALNGGNNQSATVGTAVAVAPSVKVTDANGNPVSGVSVAFTTGGGATFPGGGTSAAVATNAQGVAAPGAWILGTTAGGYSLTADVPGLAGTPVSFSASATAGAAASVTKQAGDGQAADAGSAVAVAPSVLVADQFGNPVSGAAVTFAVTAGGGTVVPTTALPTNAQGVATVTSWTLGATAGVNTLGATVGALPPVSFSATGQAGAAARLVLATPPSSTGQSGVALAQQPVVRVADQFGNPVPQAGVTVTATLASGSGTLANFTAITDAQGIAAFSGLTLTGQSGAYTLGFNAPPLTGATSGTITLGAGAATTLVMATQPSATATSGAVPATVPAVRLEDANGNTVAQAGVTVTAAVATGPGGAVLASASAVTNGSGVATFTGLSITGLVGSYTLQFSATGLASATSNSIALTAGAPTQLTITVQPPPSVASGATFAPSPVIQLRDAAGNPTGATRTILATIASGPGGAALAGASAVTNGAGAATFTGMNLTGPAGDYTITFSSALLGASVTSTTVTLGAGAASRLAVATPPSSSVQNGVVFPQQPAIQLQDGSGNNVALAGVSVLVQSLTGTGVLTGTTSVQTDAQGLVTFTNLKLTGPTGPNTLIFSALGYTGISSGTITVTPGPASQLALVTAPASTAQAGVALATQPVVELRDQSGNVVSQAGVSITAAIASGGGTLGGTTTLATAASGRSTFTDLAINGTVGTRTLTFSAAGLTSVTSAGISVAAGPAATVAASAGNNQSATVGTAVATPPQVLVTDQFGNAVSGVGVTFAVATGGGSVTGAGATTDAQGHASVGSWTLGGTAGSNTLTATSGGLAGSPVTFTATGTAAAATQLTLTTQPSASAASGAAFATQPVVQLRDGFGNAVPQAGVTVTAAIASGGGTLGGTTNTSTNGQGVATFSGLSITGVVGSRTLSFTAGALPAATSSSISITAGGAASITASAGTGQSATVGTAVATAPQVLVTDASGNPVSGVSVTFAVATGGGSATGTSATTDALGHASVGSWTLGTAAGSNTLTATSSGLTGSPVTFTATGTAAAAAAIAVNAGNGQSATVTTAVATAPSVLVTDAFNNPVSGVGVTFAVATGNGSLTGGSATTNGSGIATVGSWTLGTTAGSNTLTATSAGLTGSPVTFTATGTAGAAASLTKTQGDGQTTTVGAAVGTAPQVRVADAFGNAVSGAQVTFAVTGGGGTVVPTTPISTGATGLATATSWTLGAVAGSNTLTASSPGLTTVSFTATGIAGAAAKLAFLTTPSATAQSGVALAQQPVVELQDASGNPVAQAGLTITVTTGAGGVLTGASASTNASGIATFSGLTLSGPAGGYTLSFGSGSLTAATAGVTLGAGPAVQVAASSATAQAGTVNQGVGTLPAVLVTDNGGNPVSGVSVTFAVATGGGSGGGTVATNGSGIATAPSWTLGTVVGSNTMTATATGLTGSPVTFTATAAAGAPSSIALNAGNGQSATVNTAVATPPSVLVHDAFNNPVSGVGVTFAVASGGGSITGGSATTNASGIATVGSWTLGTTAGSNTLTATSGSLTGSPVTFTATGTAGSAAAIAASAGTGQSSTVGTAVTTPPQVLVTDQFNNPVSGVGVTFAVATGGGSITGAGATTDAQGHASVGSWTLGTVAGSNTLTATSAGLSGSPVTFTATGTAGAASHLVLSTAPSATVAAGGTFATVPVVQLRDANGNDVATAGVAVTVTVAPAGASLTGTTTVNTNGSGAATFTGLGLGGTAGSYTLSFDAGGLTGTSSGTITLIAGTPSALSIVTGDNQTGTVASSLGTQPQVLVTDAFLNPVSGFTVTFTANNGGSVNGQPTRTTDAQGHASALWTLGTTSGTQTLTVSGTGLTPASVTFTATATADAPTTLAVSAGNAQSATVGTAVATAPAARVTDQYGNGVSGVSVTFAVATGGGSLTGGGTLVTNASGVAAVGGWTLGTTAGSNTLTVTSAGLTGSPLTFTATGNPGAPAQLALATAPSSSVAAGGSFATVPVIQVRDAFGNNVTASGIAVTVTVAPAGASLLGTTTVSTSGFGLATFTGLGLGGTAGSYTLSFAASGLTGTSSGAITLSAGAADHLSFSVQPSLTAANAPITPAVEVSVLDAYDNLVTGTAVDVTISLGNNPSGTAILASATTLTRTTVNGVAAFSDLSIDTPDTGYTLVATPNLAITAATSLGFDITP